MHGRTGYATLAVALLLTGFATADDARVNAGHELQALFDEHWAWTMQDSPLYATQVGEHRYNDRLSTVTPESYAERLERERAFLSRLEAIDREALSSAQRIDYDVFDRLQRDAIAELEHRAYLMPISNRGGFHTSFPELYDRVPLATVADYENYIARLRAFETYAHEHIELMRTGIREGLVQPAVILEGIESTIEPHVVERARDSLLYQPFLEFHERIPQADRPRLAEAGRDAIMNSVVPGYRAFLDFVTAEYLPAARDSVGASDMPGGREFYRHRVRRFTTLDLTPEQVHRTGMDEVARIREEMEAIIDDVGFDGGFADFVDYLRTDERFYADSPEELLREVAWVLKRMDGELPRLFGTLPRMPYGIREVPDYIAPRTTTAYYTRPAGDGSRAGYYWVNTYDLPSRPLYELEALSLHEAVPGHHLQIALQQELEGLPEFRRFAGFTVFVEGWALYAERLGLEVGFYTDPYSDFGRLTYEMWRAARLVVDTGLHYKGWTRQQAIDFLADNTALTLHNVTTEIDRYIGWPGQALAYKIGELEIRRLREEAAAELGDAFDVRDFHDAVLASGAVPLAVLGDNVRRWVASLQHDAGDR